MCPYQQVCLDISHSRFPYEHPTNPLSPKILVTSLGNVNRGLVQVNYLAQALTVNLQHIPNYLSLFLLFDQIHHNDAYRSWSNNGATQRIIDAEMTPARLSIIVMNLIIFQEEIGTIDPQKKVQHGLKFKLLELNIFLEICIVVFTKGQRSLTKKKGTLTLL